MEERKFKFELGAEVSVRISREQGIVRGRAEYDDASNSYWTHYVDASGHAKTAWFDEKLLVDSVFTDEQRKWLND